MPSKITTLTHWMSKATAEQKAELAHLADTSVANLYQLSRGYGRASAAAAGRLADAADAMRRADRALPEVYRTDLCDACAACPYASKCLGDKAVRGSFPDAEVAPRQRIGSWMSEFA